MPLVYMEDVSATTQSRFNPFCVYKISIRTAITENLSFANIQDAIAKSCCI